MKLQQGDVLIRKMDEAAASQLQLVTGEKQNHLVLAEGESTGHKHQIVKGLAELYMLKQMMYLKVLSDFATLKHEEHKPIDIPKGTYVIDIVREYDHFSEEARRVLD